MTPLILENVLIGATPHQIAVFGFTRTQPLQPNAINDIAQDVMEKRNLTLQLVNADLVAGSDHLFFATLHAYTAFYHKKNRASTLAMEILRFAAAKRQISHALKVLGVTKSTRRFGGVLTNSKSTTLEDAHQDFLSSIEATDDVSVLDITSAKKAQSLQTTFEISDTELDAVCPSDSPEAKKQALQKLVYDRCALLTLSR
jgi:KEOPS complex subunit Cgi121